MARQSRGASAVVVPTRRFCIPQRIARSPATGRRRLAWRAHPAVGGPNEAKRASAAGSPEGLPSLSRIASEAAMACAVARAAFAVGVGLAGVAGAAAAAVAAIEAPLETV